LCEPIVIDVCGIGHFKYDARSPGTMKFEQWRLLKLHRGNTQVKLEESGRIELSNMPQMSLGRDSN
jgi:hypothetical protein